MCKHWTGFKNIALKLLKETHRKHEDCYGTFKKVVRNSEYSKSDNFKKISVWPKDSYRKNYMYSLNFSKELRMRAIFEYTYFHEKLRIWARTENFLKLSEFQYPEFLTSLVKVP